MSGPGRNSTSQAEQLRLVFHITAPAIRKAVRSLGIAEGSRGLDVGCGTGCHVQMLTHEVGPSGRLTALDLSPELLAAARAGSAADAAREAAVAGRARTSVDFVQGDFRRLPFRDSTFDWVWCSDVLWPGATCDDPVAVVTEFRRVARPGGKIALLFWSSHTLLPGHPVLEARLNAALAATIPYLAGITANSHYLRAQAWLREAGLKRRQVRTYVAQVKPPIDPEMRRATAVCFSMLWGNIADGVSAADWEAYRRLCHPDSPDFVVDIPDYYAFVTYTMFWGTR